MQIWHSVGGNKRGSADTRSNLRRLARIRSCKFFKADQAADKRELLRPLWHFLGNQANLRQLSSCGLISATVFETIALSTIQICRVEAGIVQLLRMLQ